MACVAGQDAAQISVVEGGTGSVVHNLQARVVSQQTLFVRGAAAAAAAGFQGQTTNDTHRDL
ncbi:hypothetical protein E2C01_002776 [Portunus trituberculatus]|uniref:Uncharacterized protein n=1 Tax=Portunus trituberculatus TaxID=210409 RepID=A0A5B7CKM7_PORTR|nr:hypothetical protein [Portunus trituberculatus]